MDGMENFLRSCGLDEAIPVFKENKMTVDQLEEMCRDDMKDLLPALGDRLKLKKGIKQRSRGILHDRPITKSQKKSEVKLATTKNIIKNNPEKKAFIVQMLKNDRHVAELYQMATKVLIELSLFSFDGGCRPKSSDWTLIDFADGSLNCLLCEGKIRIQTRAGSGMLWNIGNYKRHFTEEHKNDESNVLGTEETRVISSFLEVLATELKEHETVSTPLTSTELEGIPKSKEQSAGSNSECHLDSIEIPCTRKRSATDTFNEAIYKRVTIADISSEQSNVSNRLDIGTSKLSNASGFVESTAIDSVVGSESMEVVTKPVDTHQKMEEVTTEELKIDEISKEIHNSWEKADITFVGVWKPMVEGITTIPNDCTAIRTLSMKTSSSNCKDFGTVASVVGVESVITEDGNSHSHYSECTSQQKLAFDDFFEFNGWEKFESDKRMSNTNIDGMELESTSDGVINHEDKLTADATTDKLYENTKTGEKVLNAKPITSTVTALTKTPNESEPMVTEVTPAPISNQLEAYIFDGAKLITETISTGLIVNNINEAADGVLLQETKIVDISSTLTNKIKEPTAPNDCATLNESEPIQQFIGKISSGYEKIPMTINSVAVETAEPVETHQHFTAIQQTNQQKLALEVLVEDFSEQGADDVLSDVSKQLDTDSEMFVIKPNGKTATFDTGTTIATTTENNDEDQLGPVPEWRKTGVKFGWARKSNGIFYPGFLLLNEKFRWITKKGELSRYSFKPFDFNGQINQNRKDEAQIGNLYKFNQTKETSFE